MSSGVWQAEGLLFENCSCQLVCPAHISFKQNCTHARCMGHWAAHIEQGQYGDVVLDGLNAIVLFDAPQRMYEGGWIETVYIDASADEAQREALVALFTGKAGGPWAVLRQFVETWLEPRCVEIHFEDNHRQKRMWVDGYFDTDVRAIRAKDDIGEAVISNLFNQIHGSLQFLARGKTRCRDRALDFSIEGTHGLYSQFSWKGEVPDSGI